MALGAGVYFDGTSSERREVMVEAGADAVAIRGRDGTEIARWPYSELLHLSAPASLLRLGHTRGAELARLEIRDPELAAEIDRHSIPVDRTGRSERRSRLKVVAWAFAATVSLILVALFGLPAIIERITPLIPMKAEERLGAAVAPQVERMLQTGKAAAPFECGGAPQEGPGKAALDALVQRLERAAALPIPLKVAAIRRDEANAIALPGGYIFVFKGLIERSRNPDELAGVIAHEIGHVAHRDGTRSILQGAGLSFLFGMLLGDFTGGGVVVVAAQTILQSAYSREVEALADIYAVELMAKAGGEPRALGAILSRIGSLEPGVTILQDHPLTRNRVAAIDAAAARLQLGPGPLMSPVEWAALRRICG